MKRLSIVLALLMLAAPGTPSLRIVNGQASAGGGVPDKGGVGRGHTKPLPDFVEKRQKERIAAADLVARGLAAPDANGIVTLKNGRFVKYRLEGVEYLTTALIDFTDVQHGQIAQPNRAVDNSTYWSADVSPNHYYDMLF